MPTVYSFSVQRQLQSTVSQGEDVLQLKLPHLKYACVPQN